MGRGLSQQQREILSTLQYLDRQEFEELPAIWTWEEYRETIYYGFMTYGYVLLNHNNELIASLTDSSMLKNVYNPTYLGCERNLHVHSPKVHCLQSSFRRSLKRLQERGYVELKQGCVKLTQLGVDFCDYRCSDDEDE